VRGQEACFIISTIHIFLINHAMKSPGKAIDSIIRLTDGFSYIIPTHLPDMVAAAGAVIAQKGSDGWAV